MLNNYHRSTALGCNNNECSLYVHGFVGDKQPQLTTNWSKRYESASFYVRDIDTTDNNKSPSAVKSSLSK